MLFRPFPSTAIIIVAIIIVAIIKAQLNPRQGRKYRLVRLVHLNSSLPPLARGAGGQGGRGGVAHGQGAHLVLQIWGMRITGGKILLVLISTFSPCLNWSLRFCWHLSISTTMRSCSQWTWSTRWTRRTASAFLDHPLHQQSLRLQSEGEVKPTSAFCSDTEAACVCRDYL